MDSTNCKLNPQNVSGIRKFNWNPQTKCGFHLQFVDSTYNLQIPLTSADCATAQCNYTQVFLFFCGFYKIFWIPQTHRLLLSDFERYNVLSIRFWNAKQQRRSKKSSNVADTARNLILACCGIHLQCTECTA